MADIINSYTGPARLVDETASNAYFSDSEYEFAIPKGLWYDLGEPLQIMISVEVLSRGE